MVLCMFPSQAVGVLQAEFGVQDPRLQSQRTLAFLSMARFSDAQYQTIDKYMNSSEFENKQALLEKAKAEVDLIREHNVATNRSGVTARTLYMVKMAAHGHVCNRKTSNRSTRTTEVNTSHIECCL